MLQKAIMYRDEINDFMRDLDNEEYLQYYNICGCSINTFLKIDDPVEYDYISRVSIHPETKELIGYFGAETDRNHNIVNELSIVNISKKPNLYLIRDWLLFIDNLLMKYHFRKIKISIASKNSFKHMFEKLLLKLNGRMIGTSFSEYKLLNGTFCDINYYEIFKSDYMTSYIFKNKLNKKVRK